MTELYKKSLKILELPQTLQRVSGFAATESAKDRILKLEPCADRQEVERQLLRVTDAKELTVSFGSPSFGGIKDISAALERASMGGSMTIAELLRAAANFKAARLIKNYGGDRRQSTSLDVFFNGLAENRYFENKITAAFISEDEVADDASAELGVIRRKMRAAGQKARETLNKIISSGTFKNALQEQIVTIRQDRFVVPVKSEHKGEIPGLIHDMSASGATVFVEPIQAVELNNEIRMLAGREKAEIERILYEFSLEALGFSEAINRNYEILSELDFIFAKAKYSFEINGAQPAIAQDYALELKKARHPLLEKDKAVPINVSVGGGKDTLIITGPNTGGKTVTLKTIGLLSAMTMCGLHIPADETSSVPLFCEIFADIGDEQSISQSLSTFSAHMKSIIEITKRAAYGTLTLFDELGAGTDPIEGAALAIAVIERVRELGAVCAATTHYAELKAYALSADGVENASCEFDVETLRPTYRLITGIPGKSNAFAISEKLGLDREIIQNAKKHVSEDAFKFEDMLEKLEKLRTEAEAYKEQAQRIRREQEQKTERADQRLQTIEQQCEKIKKDAEAEALGIIKEAKEQAERTLAEAVRIRNQTEKGGFSDNIDEARARLKGSLNEQERRLAEKMRKKAQNAGKHEFKVGDSVLLYDSKIAATVIRAADKDGNVLVKAGIMQVKVNQSELMPAANPGGQGGQKKHTYAAQTAAKSRNANSSLDLRGLASDEAIQELDSFISDAVMANLGTVTIIHGKGTGVLRAAVHERLKHMKCVKSFRLGRFGEGENGVTIAEIE